MITKDFLDYFGLVLYFEQLKTLFATKDEVISKQSDWNVTDESSLAYIKNKPPSTIYSTSEPTTQNNGDIWMQEY